MTGDVGAHVLNGRVPRETADRLDQFVELLTKWNKTINLVSNASLANVWQRHIDDSAQLLQLAEPSAERWGDLGSGGGLPGVVVAILAKVDRPNLDVILVESDQRKCAFLRTVSHTLSLNVTVIADRIEACPPLQCDIVSARALAPLSRLLPFATKHLKPGGKGLFMKGKDHEAEIETARKGWSFRTTLHPSVTDPAAVILEVSHLAHDG